MLEKITYPSMQGMHWQCSSGSCLEKSILKTIRMGLVVYFLLSSTFQNGTAVTETP